jgi:NAD(P) transhydrogenase subunit alpha
MNPNPYADQAARIADQAGQLATALRDTAVTTAAGLDHAAAQAEPFIALFAVFLMACFVGYYVVWNVTPALHSPLMGVTNAISSVIVVGAMLATGFAFNGVAMAFGFLAVLLASVNIFGGFLVTQRMLSMFQARKR